jgi:hypothetical protein|tara:strand:+ start:324 stop:695 length:372 start_codon:yes stop_codon:yes gene_type:complete
MSKINLGDQISAVVFCLIVGLLVAAAVTPAKSKVNHWQETVEMRCVKGATFMAEMTNKKNGGEVFRREITYRQKNGTVISIFRYGDKDATSLEDTSIMILSIKNPQADLADQDICTLSKGNFK